MSNNHYLNIQEIESSSDGSIRVKKKKTKRLSAYNILVFINIFFILASLAFYGYMISYVNDKLYVMVDNALDKVSHIDVDVSNMNSNIEIFKEALCEIDPAFCP
jgi:hypothetical protein